MNILIKKPPQLSSPSRQSVRQAGGLMIEMLASMLIGVLLLSGALTVMLSSSKGYKTRSALADLDERGRLALELMAQDIRRAGYRGCGYSESRPIVRTFTTSADEAWLSPESGVRGWEYQDTGFGTDLDLYSLQESNFSSSAWSSSGAFEKGFGTKVLRHSDAIELWPAQPYVMDVASADEGIIWADSTSSMSGFPSGDDNHYRLLLVSDCDSNLLVKTYYFGSRFASLDSGRNNSSAAKLTGIKDGEAVMLEGVVYFLRVPTGGDSTRPGLYRKKLGIDKKSSAFKPANAQEIIPNVVSLQFLYGEATSENLSVNRYVPAHQVGDWDNVVSVRIYLLAETDKKNVSSEPMDFIFYGRTFSPENSSDTRVRREYTKTVTLRNRSVSIALSAAEE